MSFTYYLSKFVRILRGRTRPYTCAVILAAGSGTRMKSEDGTTKQMLLLCGEPVLVHSLRAFDSCKYIDEIVLVCKAEEIEVAKSLVEQYNIKKVTNICKGGSERSESAILGMACVPSKAEYVAFTMLPVALSCRRRSPMSFLPLMLSARPPQAVESRIL